MEGRKSGEVAPTASCKVNECIVPVFPALDRGQITIIVHDSPWCVICFDRFRGPCIFHVSSGVISIYGGCYL